MRKTLIAALAALLLTACSTSPQRGTRKEQKTPAGASFQKIKFEGHDYILYQDTTGRTGITHDPDCCL